MGEIAAEQVRVVFACLFACSQTCWFVWDLSSNSWYYDMRLHDFDPLPWPSGHLKRVFGRWKFLTVWTMDMCFFQSVDALAAVMQLKTPNRKLQSLCLVMSSIVTLGLPTGMPFHTRRDIPTQSNLWNLVGPGAYNALGVWWNLWCHLLVACLQIYQASSITHIPVTYGLWRQPWLSCSFIASWALFSETVVRWYASQNSDGTVQFPYGPLMQWPLRPLLYVVLVLLAAGVSMLYEYLHLIQVGAREHQQHHDQDMVAMLVADLGQQQT